MFRRTVGSDERLVVFRSGKLHRIEGPGEALTVPLLEQAYLVSLKPVRADLSLPEVQVVDGWVSAIATMEWAVLQPEKACLQIERVPLGPSIAELVEAAFRVAAANVAIDRLSSPNDRAMLGRAAKKAANETALEWGVDVRAVEVTELAAIATPIAEVAWKPVPIGEDHNVCNVLLREVGDDVLDVIRVLRRLTGWGLDETRTLVAQAPSVLMKRVRRAEAEEIERALEAVGARVELL